MIAGSLLTLGLGDYSDINHLVTLGFGVGSPAPAPSPLPEIPYGGGGPGGRITMPHIIIPAPLRPRPRPELAAEPAAGDGIEEEALFIFTATRPH
jgi:hypothetical protein